MKITNTSDGPRGFHSSKGFVNLEKEEAWEGEMSETEAKSAKATGYFDISGTSAKADKTA